MLHSLTSSQWKIKDSINFSQGSKMNMLKEMSRWCAVQGDPVDFNRVPKYNQIKPMIFRLEKWWARKANTIFKSAKTHWNKSCIRCICCWLCYNHLILARASILKGWASVGVSSASLGTPPLLPRLHKHKTIWCLQSQIASLHLPPTAAFLIHQILSWWTTTVELGMVHLLFSLTNVLESIWPLA